MSIDKVNPAQAQSKTTEVKNDPKEASLKETKEAVQIHAAGKILSKKNTKAPNAKNSTKASKAKKSTKKGLSKMKRANTSVVQETTSEGKESIDSVLAKVNSGQALSQSEVNVFSDAFKKSSQSLKSTSDKLTSQKSFSESDASDYSSSLKNFNVLLLAMVAMLNNQHGSQDQITSLGKLSQNLNDAVTAWQKTSTFWLTAYFKFGNPNDATGGFAPGVNPGNIDNPSFKPVDPKTYPGVANTTGATTGQMMGIYNHLSTKFSGASTRLATTAGLPGQLTTAINSQIQTGMSAMQAIQQANSSMLQTVMQWN